MTWRLVPPGRWELRFPGVDARRKSAEGRLRTKPKRGGAGESRSQLLSERSEGEVKSTRAGVWRLRPTVGEHARKTSKVTWKIPTAKLTEVNEACTQKMITRCSRP